MGEDQTYAQLLLWRQVRNQSVSFKKSQIENHFCYVEFLKCSDIHISMCGKGRALDNVFIERLWRSVKQEYVYLNPCLTGQELWRGLSEYFQFYNTERPHQSLNYLPQAKC